MKHEVEIFDISYEGAGVGKLDGKVVFVPKCLKSEKVEIEIVKENSKFIQGRLSRVVLPSEKRVEPFCPYFSVCGGCDFQHCDYETEKEIKLEILKEELKKVGFCGDITFEESKDRFFYRNKIKFEVKENSLGYFKPKSHEFFAVKKCPIASQKINQTIPLIEEFLKGNDFKFLKNVYIKQFGETVGICFLFEKSVKNVKKIEIFDNFLVFFAFGEILESNSTKIVKVFGNKNFSKNVLNLKVESDISAFNQVNDDVAEKLYDYILKNTADKRVVNAYSGQGLLTALIAKKAKFVYGIEFQKSAHDAAEKLCNQFSEHKIENICGKVEDVLPQILLRDYTDLIVLDPAREGCDEKVLDAISSSKIESVIYVSCNFSTLVRDLKKLTKNYAIESVKIFDMFPCTANMETVVILKRLAL